MTATETRNAMDAANRQAGIIDAPKKALLFKKRYTFGRNDAEVTVFHGTKIARVVRFDPVGIDQPVVQWTKDYSTAHGIAKLHSLLAKEKYG